MKKILLVEDDYDIGIALKTVFETSGFKCEVVGSQEYAVFLLLTRNQFPDILCVTSQRQLDLVVTFHARRMPEVRLVVPPHYPINLKEIVAQVKKSA